MTETLTEQIERRKLLLEGCQILSGLDPDRAASRNDMGWNGLDGEFGHKLAQLPWSSWTPTMMAAARKLLLKYHRQLPFDPASIPEISQHEIDAHKAARAEARQVSLSTWAREENGQVVIHFHEAPRYQVTNLCQEAGGTFDKKALQWGFRLSSLTAPTLLKIFDAVSELRNHSLIPRLKEIVEASAKLAELSAQSTAELELEDVAITPYPFQKAGVQYALQAKRCMIADQMGLGKTIQALLTVHAAKAYPAVVVCPASLVYNWAREIIRALPKAYVGICEGNTYALNADILVVSYSQMKKWLGTLTKVEIPHPHIIGQKKKKPQIRYDYTPGLVNNIGIRALVIDESHYLKNTGAQRTHLVKSFVKATQPEYVLLLSGTPIPNRPVEFASQLEIMDRLKEFGGYKKFVDRYCPSTSGYGGNNGAANLQELNKKLRGLCYVRREKMDVLTELPPKTYSTVNMEITNRKEYDRADADVAQWCAEQAAQKAGFLEGIKHLTGEAREQAIKIEMSTVRSKTESAEALRRFGVLSLLAARGKMEPVVEWCENLLEQQEKLILFATNIEIQKRLLNDLSHWSPGHIFGDDDAKERDDQVLRFQKTDDCRLMICSLDAGGVGWTGTAASNVAFVQFGWTPGGIDQAADRAHRIGQLDNVTVHYLMGQNTVDEDRCELIDKKRGVVSTGTTGVESEMNASILGDLMARYAKKGGFQAA